jgi:hypothetical protein
MIYCGSGFGSDFEKVLNPVPVPAPVPDTENIEHSFPTRTKNLYTVLSFSISEALLFPRKLASRF